MASITPLQCLLQVHTPQHKHPKEKPPILFSLFCQSTFPLQTLLIRRRAKALDFAVFWQQVRWWTPLTSQTTLAGHGPPAPAFLSFTTHVSSPALLHPETPLLLSLCPKSPLSSLSHCHILTFHNCESSPSLSQAMQELGPGLADTFLPKTLPCNVRWISCDWKSLALVKPFFGLSVSAFCSKAQMLMWKKSLGTMYGQKEWKTPKENAQDKMGALGDFLIECVTAP